MALPSVSDMSARWVEMFLLEYGESEHQVGASLGGDGGGLMLGPDYGVQAADGTWWLLDKAKVRLAHFSDSGDYLDSVSVKPEHLVNGHFQFQLPRALDDGLVVASRMGGATAFFLLDTGDTSVTSVPGRFVTKIDDGRYLYGFSETNSLLRLDPRAGTVDNVDYFMARNGTRFRLLARGDEITIELPDSPARKEVKLRVVYAGDPSVPAFVGVEAATGSDGTIHLLLTGGTDSGVGGQLGGFLSISPDGVVSDIESIRDPYSPSDPGSPAHLGMRPGASQPWLMFIDPDGVRVYERT